jgi:rabconnectin-3a
MTLTTCPPLAAHDFEPFALFNAQKQGLVRVAINDHESHRNRTAEEEPIEKFFRTPDGRGVAVVRASGGEAWAVAGHQETVRLQRVGRWHSKGAVAILDGGMLPHF